MTMKVKLTNESERPLIVRRGHEEVGILEPGASKSVVLWEGGGGLQLEEGREIVVPSTHKPIDPADHPDFKHAGPPSPPQPKTKKTPGGGGG